MKNIWTTKHGEEIKISDMETSHIINSMNLLKRTAKIGVDKLVSLGYLDDDNFPSYDEYFLIGKDFLKETPYKALLREYNNRLKSQEKR